MDMHCRAAIDNTVEVEARGNPVLASIAVPQLRHCGDGFEAPAGPPAIGIMSRTGFAASPGKKVLPMLCTSMIQGWYISRMVTTSRSMTVGQSAW